MGGTQPFEGLPIRLPPMSFLSDLFRIPQPQPRPASAGSAGPAGSQKSGGGAAPAPAQNQVQGQAPQPSRDQFDARPVAVQQSSQPAQAPKAQQDDPFGIGHWID